VEYNIIVIHCRDNVGVAMEHIHPGEKAVAKGSEAFHVLEEIPSSHKVALRDIGAGEEIIKYGEVIAVSTRAIKQGEWVHTHNLESQRCGK
jgi:altronate hydrolase